MKPGRWAAVGLAFLAVLQAGCLVEIHHVNDAAAAFASARAEVARDQGRRGRVHRLNLLVFDPEECELVRISLPMWLARKVQGRIHWGERAPGRGEDRFERRLASRLRVQDLAAAGPGLIADVEDEDGGQVLVWLR